jgi:hypothetical protein
VEVEGEGVRLLRGKLRDKRSDPSRERSRREQLERRRPPKRESRISILRIQHLEEDYLFGEEDAQLVTTTTENQ